MTILFYFLCALGAVAGYLFIGRLTAHFFDAVVPYEERSYQKKRDEADKAFIMATWPGTLPYAIARYSADRIAAWAREAQK